MKLTEEQAEEIIRKVHADLDLYHGSDYPVVLAGHEKDHEMNDEPFARWIGGFDYRNPIGDDGWGKYPEYNVIIDDEKGEAVQYGYYTGHYAIELNDKGKYTVVKQLYR